MSILFNNKKLLQYIQYKLIQISFLTCKGPFYKFMDHNINYKKINIA